MAEDRPRPRLHARRQVLILDEPTAALDARGRVRGVPALPRAEPGKTAVLISHRFSTVRMADRILVLREGRSWRRHARAARCSAVATPNCSNCRRRAIDEGTLKP